MKELSLTHLHKLANARMVDYSGFYMPVEYSGVIHEIVAVRNSAGIFDASHMGQFWVKGQYAFDLVQQITTNDISNLKEGCAQYSCMTNENGGIVDDLIVYRYGVQKYMLVVNASNTEKDWQWINKMNSFGAELENATENMSLIALQGPKAKQILQAITNNDVINLKPFSFITTSLAGNENVIISATGYTGAGGFEIYCFNQASESIWQALMACGKSFGLVPAGLASRDTLRLEMGYCLYGNDIDDNTSPIEAGLGWVTKFIEGKNFPGRTIIEDQKLNGTARKLVGFEMQERAIPRHGYLLFDKDQQQIGTTTSGTLSPTINKGIGMAYIDKKFAIVGQEIYLQVRNKYLKARIVKMPFI